MASLWFGMAHPAECGPVSWFREVLDFLRTGRSDRAQRQAAARPKRIMGERCVIFPT